MNTGTRTITYSDEVRDAVSEKMNNALRKHGWTQAQAADMAGVEKGHISVLTRTMPEGMSVGYFVKSFMGVDVNPLDVLMALDLTKEVEAHIANPETRHHYPNMACLLGSTTTEGSDPMQVLLRRVPPDKRQMARTLIENVIETMNK